MASALSGAAGAAAGTSPPAPAVQTDSRDDSAVIWCGTGTSPTTGTFVTLTLGGNYSGADEGAIPRANVTFIGNNARLAALYVASVTTNQVVIGAGSAPTASQPATSAGGFGVVLTIDV